MTETPRNNSESTGLGEAFRLRYARVLNSFEDQYNCDLNFVESENDPHRPFDLYEPVRRNDALAPYTEEDIKALVIALDDKFINHPQINGRIRVNFAVINSSGNLSSVEYIHSQGNEPRFVLRIHKGSHPNDSKYLNL